MVRVSTCFAKAAAFRGVILGAPASGKGTVSSKIVNTFGITHISSGDKLRYHVSHDTEIGKEVKRYMEEGSYVPDETMISLIEREIAEVGDRSWLLDGFPRTLKQAEKLQATKPVNVVLNLIVPHFVILNRVKNRWIHQPSGRIYNIGFNDPKVAGKDDVTGEALTQRTDDKPEVVQKRLQDYATKTEPVISYYRDAGILKEFRGNTTAEMWPHIKDCLERYM